MTAVSIQQKPDYSSINCLKVLGAFFVVCIHTVNNLALTPFIRTAVPIFFMISGYFLYNENKEVVAAKCQKAIKKIFWITFYSNLFYYLVVFFNTDPFPIQTFKRLLRFLLIGDTLGFHLWYLNAYLECLIIFYFFILTNKIKYFLWFIPIFIIWGLATGSYQFIFPFLPNNLFLSRNVFTMGIPCVGIGFLLHKYKDCIISYFRQPLILLFVLAVLIECEVWGLNILNPNPQYPGDFYFFTYPFAVIMLITAIKYPLWGRNTLMEKIGFRYSLYIYIFHLFLLNFILDIFPGNSIPIFILPFLIFFFALFFSIIWEKASFYFFPNKLNRKTT